MYIILYTKRHLCVEVFFNFKEKFKMSIFTPRGVKVKLQLSQIQLEFFEQNAGAARFVFNRALARQTELYNNYVNWSNENPSLSRLEYPFKLRYTYNELAKLLQDDKQSVEFNWLNLCESTCLQQSLRNLDSAYKNFFDSLKGARKGAPVGPPRFKSKKKSRPSFRVINNNNKKVIDGNKLFVNKLGWVKVWSGNKRLLRAKGKCKSVTYFKDSDNCWYASLLVEKYISPKHESTGETCGLDLGIKVSATLNNEVEYLIPNSLIKLERKLVKLQRIYSRRLEDARERAKILTEQTGIKQYITGSNLEKARIKLSKCHYRIKMIRQDFQHKLSNELAKQFDVITIETLNIKGMMKNHSLAKSIATQGWFQFTTFLKYKFADNNKILIQVNQWFPSSKLCSTCGHKNTSLKLNHREWICPTCGTNHSRDINAAKNLNRISQWFLKTGETITTEVQYINKLV